jgi:hypothetical protein
MDYRIPDDLNQDNILGEGRKMPALALVEETVRKRTRTEGQEDNLQEKKQIK